MVLNRPVQGNGVAHIQWRRECGVWIERNAVERDIVDDKVWPRGVRGDLYENPIAVVALVELIDGVEVVGEQQDRVCTRRQIARQRERVGLVRIRVSRGDRTRGIAIHEVRRGGRDEVDADAAGAGVCIADVVHIPVERDVVARVKSERGRRAGINGAIVDRDVVQDQVRRWRRTHNGERAVLALRVLRRRVRGSVRGARLNVDFSTEDRSGRGVPQAIHTPHDISIAHMHPRLDNR